MIVFIYTHKGWRVTQVTKSGMMRKFTDTVRYIILHHQLTLNYDWIQVHLNLFSGIITIKICTKWCHNMTHKRDIVFAILSKAFSVRSTTLGSVEITITHTHSHSGTKTCKALLIITNWYTVFLNCWMYLIQTSKNSCSVVPLQQAPSLGLFEWSTKKLWWHLILVKRRRSLKEREEEMKEKRVKWKSVNSFFVNILKGS